MKPVLLAAGMVAATLSVHGGRAQSEEVDYAGLLLTNQSLLTAPPKTCDVPGAALDTFQLQQCSAVAFKAADQALNMAYGAALRRGTPSQTAALKQAQRQWLAFRNSECAWEAGQYGSGTGAPVAMGTCLVAVTRARTQQLQTAFQP